MGDACFYSTVLHMVAGQLLAVALEPAVSADDTIFWGYVHHQRA